MNQINLREAPLVDKPEDGATLFALNQDGTINRIKADGVGGNKMHYIDIDFASMSALAISNLQESSSQETVKVPCSCDTLTFAEAKAAFLAGEYLQFVARGDLSMVMGDDGTCYEFVPITCANYLDNGGERIVLASYCILMQMYMYIVWTDSEIYFTNSAE